MGTSASPCLVQDVPVHEPGAVAQAHQFHHLGQLRCVDTGWENHVSVGRVLVLNNHPKEWVEEDCHRIASGFSGQAGAWARSKLNGSSEATSLLNLRGRR